MCEVILNAKIKINRKKMLRKEASVKASCEDTACSD